MKHFLMCSNPIFAESKEQFHIEAETDMPIFHTSLALQISIMIYGSTRMNNNSPFHVCKRVGFVRTPQAQGSGSISCLLPKY